jgi:hypothetical protein
VHVVEDGRRGYAIVDGRDVRGEDEVVVEQGVAHEWGIAVGDRLEIGEPPGTPVVGIARSPDNVAYPLAAVPRVYVDASAVPAQFRPLPVNLGMVWLRDRSRQDVTLAQARGVTFALRDLRFVTRAGVQVLVGQAAGIVIALLVAFSLVAVATAGVMLGASARAEVARGCRRSACSGPSASRAGASSPPRRCAACSSPRPAQRSGSQRAGWRCGRRPTTCWPRSTRSAAAGRSRGGWPARGSRRSRSWPRRRPGRRGGRPRRRSPRCCAAASSPHSAPPQRADGARRRRLLGAGLPALGARLATARRGRWLTTVALLAAASATLVLLLALASLLVALRDDPAIVGKNYTLTAPRSPSGSPRSSASRGWPRPHPRYTVNATAAFSLGQPLRLVAFPSGDAAFEAPPLDEGRRRRGAARSRSGAAWPTRSGCGPARSWPSRCRRGTRSASA